MRRLILGLALTAGISSPGLAFEETWVGAGGASEVIIGSMTVKIDGNVGTITFQNGKKLSLQQVPGQEGVYNVVPPQDPILRRGTRLCGMDTPITLVVLQLTGSDQAEYRKKERGLTVYAGKDLCADYPLFEKKAFDKDVSEASPHKPLSLDDDDR